MWTFVGKKENEVWIWSVVVEFRDGRIGKYLFVGDRSVGSFLKDTGELRLFTKLCKNFYKWPYIVNLHE